MEKSGVSAADLHELVFQDIPQCCVRVVESQVNRVAEMLDATADGAQSEASPVTLEIQIGKCRLNAEELAAVCPGSLIQLDDYVSDPVSIYRDTRLIGRGELIQVHGQLGLRLTEDYRGREPRDYP